MSSGMHHKPKDVVVYLYFKLLSGKGKRKNVKLMSWN